jgi:hypothetical protein
MLFRLFRLFRKKHGKKGFLGKSLAKNVKEVL